MNLSRPPFPNHKLFLHQPYSPKRTFLSPASKFNQRSLSASSLPYTQSKQIQSGSLRQQIKLDSFKRNTYDSSKLNKTALHRATLKVECEQRSLFRQDNRAEVRELQKDNAVLREENIQLKQQRTGDLVLIERQSQLLKRLERDVEEMREGSSRQRECECYLIEQYLQNIRGLEMKLSHYEQQKIEFKKEIRELVIKQQRLKQELSKTGIKQKMVKEDRIKRVEKVQRIDKYQRINTGSSKGQYEQRIVQRDKRKVGEISHQSKKQGQGVTRYMEYLKNIRNREIDEIDSILREQD